MSEDKKEEALKKIEDNLDKVKELITEAQKLADEHGIVFRVDLNGTSGRYYGKGSENNEDYGGHPYDSHGWVNSSMDC